MTTKMGSSDKRPGTEARVFVPSCKMYGSEVLMSLFIMGAGFFGIMSGHHWGMSAYLLLQGGSPAWQCLVSSVGAKDVGEGGRSWNAAAGLHVR